MLKLQEIENWNEALELYWKFIKQFLNFLMYFLQSNRKPLTTE
jgi:hypothetical protein